MPTLATYEFLTMTDVYIAGVGFNGNLCSTHIDTEENIHEMCHDMPPASNEESITELASYFIDELIQFTDKRKTS